MLGMVDGDYELFKNLFSIYDEANYDGELRQRYRVAPFERKFRKDQSP